jgi:hypothetical protein
VETFEVQCVHTLRYNRANIEMRYTIYHFYFLICKPLFFFFFGALTCSVLEVLKGEVSAILDMGNICKPATFLTF